jgi:hypothetical protein
METMDPFINVPAYKGRDIKLWHCWLESTGKIRCIEYDEDFAIELNADRVIDSLIRCSSIETAKRVAKEFMIEECILQEPFTSKEIPNGCE